GPSSRPGDRAGPAAGRLLPPPRPVRPTRPSPRPAASRLDHRRGGCRRPPPGRRGPSPESPLVNGRPTLEHARTRRLRRCTAQACTALIVQHSPVGWKKNLIVTDFGCIYRRPHVHSEIRWPQVLFQSKEPLFEGQTDLSPQNP